MGFCSSTLSIYVCWISLYLLKTLPSMGQDYEVIAKKDIKFEDAVHIKAFRLGKDPAIIVSTSDAIVMFNLTQLDLGMPDVLLQNLTNPREVAIVKDIFRFTGLVVTHGNFENETSFDGILVVDAGSLAKELKVYKMFPPAGDVYDSPIFLTSYTLLYVRYYKDYYGTVYGELSYAYTSETHGFQTNWTSQKVQCEWHSSTIWNVIRSEIIHEQTSVFFGILETRGLISFWPTDSSIEHTLYYEHGRKNVYYLEFIDVNIDGKADLVAASGNNGGDVAAFEIHKSSSNWTVTIKMHGIVSAFSHEAGCPSLVRKVVPSKNYTGKPWLLVAGKSCTKASYLFPKEPLDKNNWEYEEVMLASGLKGAPGIDSIDMDGDGYEEIFVSDGRVIKWFTFKEKLQSSTASDELPLKMAILTCFLASLELC